MKRMLLLVVLALSATVLAEDHTGDTGTASGRPAVDPNQNLNKLYQMISSCTNSRPGAGGVVPFNLPPQLPKTGVGLNDEAPVDGTALPAGDTGGGSGPVANGGSSGDSTRGSQIYQTRCLACHSANKQAPSLTQLKSAEKMAAVSSGLMPKGSSLSEQEKADLFAFLQSQP